MESADGMRQRPRTCSHKSTFHDVKWKGAMVQEEETGGSSKGTPTTTSGSFEGKAGILLTIQHASFAMMTDKYEPL